MRTLTIHTLAAMIAAAALPIHAQAHADHDPATARRVRFEQRVDASDAPITLYRLKGYVNYGFGPRPPSAPYGAAPEFDLVCTAPCLADLTPGTYQLALGRGTAPPVLALDGSYQLQGNETLVGHFDSRSTLRTAGVVMLLAAVASVIASSVVAIHALSRDPHEQLLHAQPFPSGWVTAGLIGGAALGLAGLWMAAQPNAPALEVRPPP